MLSLAISPPSHNAFRDIINLRTMEFSNPFADTVPRRNFTAPIGSHIQRPSTSAGETSNALVDTLYDHPSVKITSFTAGSRPLTLGPTPPDTPTGVEPGSLPWSSHLERTIAVGMSPNGRSIYGYGSLTTSYLQDISESTVPLAQLPSSTVVPPSNRYSQKARLGVLTRIQASSSYKFGGLSTGASRCLSKTRRIYNARNFYVRFLTKSYNSKRPNALSSDPSPSSYPNAHRRRLLRGHGLLLGDLVNPPFQLRSARSRYPPR